MVKTRSMVMAEEKRKKTMKARKQKKKDITRIRLKPRDPRENKLHQYKLHYKATSRRKALNEAIQNKVKLGKFRSIHKAAVAKKARLNVLRIYRRNKDKSNCKKITYDMRYIDRKFLKGKGTTNDLC